MTLSPISLFAESGGGGHHIADFGIHFYVGAVILAIFIFIFLARKGFGERVFKNPVTQLAEQMYIFIEGLAVGVVGSGGRKYVPFLLTLWLFIFMSNIIGLALPHTPTASWSWNVGLAIVVFVYVQIEGIKANGTLGHLSHFAGPKLPFYFIPITLLILVVEVLGEFIKIVSLSLRLYGNINGGHLVKGSLDSIIEGVPLGALVMPLEILVAIIQALVFTMLATIYLSLVTHHEDDHGDEHEAGEHGAEAAA